MVRHQGLHHKMARGPNKNLVVVFCPSWQNRGERTSVGNVVDHIRRRIALIFLR